MADASAQPPPAPRRRASGRVTPNHSSRGQRLLAWIVVALMRLLAATLRYRVSWAVVPSGPVIFALWHNRLGLCMKAYELVKRDVNPEAQLAALISASKDGAFLAAMLKDFQVQPVRGSSSRRGAQALIELTTWAKRGYNLAITPDGPRGPGYVVQEGVMALAQITGLPIIPFSCRLGWKIRIRSWDRFQIPLPFSRCEMIFAEPIPVPRRITAAEREQFRLKLENTLKAITRDE